MRHSARTAVTLAVEEEAEILVVHQLDLLSQLEAQVRAVHHAMRSIEKLRSARFRVGPELSDGDRHAVVGTLSTEITAIDEELNIQHQTCEDMQRSIRDMQAALASLKRRASLSD